MEMKNHLKIKYIGEDCRGLVNGKTYDIEWNANPRYVWVDTGEVQKTYINLTYFALDWDIIDKDALNKGYDPDYEMRRYIEKMNYLLP
jgi:hypothetical protein